MVEGVESSDNHLFRILENGMLVTNAVLDYESNSSHQVVVQVADDYNGSFVRSFSISVLNLFEDLDEDGIEDHLDLDADGDGVNDSMELSLGMDPQDSNSRAHAPLILTKSFIERDSSRSFLEGKVLANDGGTVSEVGFLIGRSIGLGNATRLIAELDPITMEFESVANGLVEGARYYYRAYGSNQIGKSLGSIRSFFTPSSYLRWWSDLPMSPEGWVVDSWLGSFKPYEHDWIYHPMLGWVYMEPKVSEGIWLWLSELGWCWTNRSAWPSIYCAEEGIWLRTIRVQDKTHFFDYSTNSIRSPSP